MPRKSKQTGEPPELQIFHDTQDKVEILETDSETNTQGEEKTESISLENQETQIKSILDILKDIKSSRLFLEKQRKTQEKKSEPTTSTEYLEIQNEMLKKLEEFHSIHKSFKKEITKNYEMIRVLEPTDPLFFQTIEQCVSNIEKLLAEIKKLEIEVQSLPKRIDEINTDYNQQFLQENNFFSYQEISDAQHDCFSKLEDLKRSNFLSKWFSKKEIENLQKEYDRLRALSNNKGRYVTLPYISDNDFEIKNETTERDITNLVILKVISHFEHSLEPSTEKEPLSPQIIRDIQEELLQSQVLSEIQKYNSRSEFSQEDVSAILSLARDAAENTYSPHSVQTNEFSRNIEDLPNTQLKVILTNFVRTYNGETNRIKLQALFDICTRFDEIVKQENLRHSYRRHLNKLDDISRSDYYSQDNIRRARQRFEASPSQIDTLIENFDQKQWTAFLQNPEIRSRIGEEKIAQMDAFLVQRFSDELVEVDQNRDTRIKLERDLYSFRDPSVIPIHIFNAFSEFGHGVRPFIPNSPGEKNSMFNDAIKGLDQKQIEALEALKIPGLFDIIELVQKHPGTYFFKEFWDNSSNTYIQNPLYHQTQEALQKITLHFLKNGQRTEQFLAAKTLANVDASFGDEYTSIETLLTTSKDETLKKKILESLIEKNRRQDDKEALALLFKNFKEIDDESRNYLKKQFPVILEQFIDTTYTKKIINPEELSGLSLLSGYSPETLNSLIDFFSYLANTQYFSYRGNTNDTKSIERYISIAENNDAIILVKKLSSYGYRFQMTDTENILSVASDPSTLKNIDRIGACINEKFLKLKGYHDFTLWREALANPNQTADILEDLPAETWKELPNFIEYGKIYASFSLEKRQRGYALLLKILESPTDLLRKQKTSLLPKMETEPTIIHGKFIQSEPRNPEDIYQEASQIVEILQEMPEDIFSDKTILNVFIEHKKEFLHFSEEKRKVGFTLIEKIYRSPSQEIQRLREQLFLEILHVDNPEKTFAEVENIFIKNNLPLVGKIYKVFEILHPTEILNNKLKENESSPVLVHATDKKRRLTIYTDLLRIHIESGNRSLKHYLEFLEAGEKLFDKIDSVGEENLSAREKKMALAFIKKLETLSENIDLPPIDRLDESSVSLKSELQQLKSNLGVKKGQSLNGRILEIFAKPLGFESISEALHFIKRKKQTAHERNIQSVHDNTTETDKKKECTFTLQENDLLKGVTDTYISQILQNGSVAKEFLGASSDSDSTPLDTDTSRVLQSDLEGGFTNTYKQSIAKGYGNLCLVIKDRGQFELTSAEHPKQKDTSKLELFATPVVNQRHYGIRTGFPTTEIDFMIAQDEFVNDTKRLHFLYCELAKNGYYIPVVDTTGKLLFTPEMFEAHRKAYEGLETFDAEDLSVVRTTPENSHFEQISVLQSQMEKDQKHLEQILENIRSTVQKTLSEFGIILKDEFSSSITDAEFYDTGSTGRGTFTPGSYDFDYTLKLSDRDMKKIPDIVKAIQAKLNPDADYSKSHNDESGYYQFRADNVKIGKDENLAIDIGFGRKNELSEFSSHDAINGKLANIEKTQGKEVRKEVVANIVLTKQILKEAGIYKKLDKGLGGIGVETWLLQHGGNMIEAFRAFSSAAHYEGVTLPFDEFKKRYAILDAGINIKHLQYDNFVYHLSDETYQKMLTTIKKYIPST